MDWIQQWQSKLNKQNGVAPLVRTGGSRHTGLAALPHRNIQLNNLRPYYFRHILTELPKYCDKKGNIDPAKLNHLMPWAEELPEECRKPRRS